MTWTATERETHNRTQITTDIADEADHLVCRLSAWKDDHAAVQQMRARARLIVQAEAASKLCELIDDLDAAEGLSSDGLDYIQKRARAIIKATGGEE